MQYLFYILVLPILYINIKICLSDIQNKKIPNIYLKYLLFFVPVIWGIFIYGSDIGLLPMLLLQTSLGVIIGFLLYYFGVWAPGDAKYLIVLSLLIPQTSIITFIGNIALILLAYLLGYFLWFWLGKGWFIKHHYKNTYSHIKDELSHKIKIYQKNASSHIIFMLLRSLVGFLTVFITLRLIRIYLLEYSLIQGSYFALDPLYIIGGFAVSFILLFFILKRGYHYIYDKYENIFEKYNISKILLIITASMLSIYMGISWLYNPSETTDLLYRIFVIYISLFIVIKILLYSYRLVFIHNESYMRNISDIQPGYNIDKASLIASLYDQGGYKKWCKKKGYSQKYITKISTILDSESIKDLQEIFVSMQKDNKKNKNEVFDETRTPLTHIKLLHTFAFAPYIFAGAIVTYIYGSSIFQAILSLITQMIQYLIGSPY